jgi:hypothetical protein
MIRAILQGVTCWMGVSNGLILLEELFLSGLCFSPYILPIESLLTKVTRARSTVHEAI